MIAKPPWLLFAERCRTTLANRKGVMHGQIVADLGTCVSLMSNSSTEFDVAGNGARNLQMSLAGQSFLLCATIQ